MGLNQDAGSEGGREGMSVRDAAEVESEGLAICLLPGVTGKDTLGITPSGDLSGTQSPEEQV